MKLRFDVLEPLTWADIAAQPEKHVRRLHARLPLGNFENEAPHGELFRFGFFADGEVVVSLIGKLGAVGAKKDASAFQIPAPVGGRVHRLTPYDLPIPNRPRHQGSHAVS